MAFTIAAIENFEGLIPGRAKLEFGKYALSTTARENLVPPEGVVIYDTDLGITFSGDGVTTGGVSVGNKGDVRTYTVAAASAFTNPSTYPAGAVQTAATNKFTLTTHGLSAGDSITLMSSDGTAADVGLVVDTAYTVASVVDANNVTLTGVTFSSDDTQALVFVETDATVNNKVTWAGAATLRTGDAITSAEVGTLPSGVTGLQYIVKDATTPTATSFKLASSRNNALAGTTIVVRSEGAGANTFVASDIYLDLDDTFAVCDAAATVDIYLPSAVTYDYKSFTVSHGAGTAAAAVTVKSVAGKVGKTAAATGRVLKVSTDDFISVRSNGTDWIIDGIQVTA